VAFPPAKPKVGNFADASYYKSFPRERWIEGYDDGYATTSPVGSFAPNAYGLFDMGGNVWQWCEDGYDKHEWERVQRGAAWDRSQRDFLLSSRRGHSPPVHRGDSDGFRCVIGASTP
jgi:formylglycine-generating enzyme required for sulfatase activity